MYNDIYDKEQFAYMHSTLCKWLKLKIDGNGLAQLLKNRGIDSIILYGIGGLGEYAYEELKNSQVKISYIVDKRYRDFPNGYDSISVIGLEQIPENMEEYVLVTPIFYFNDILKDLTANNVKIEKVMSLSMLLS